MEELLVTLIVQICQFDSNKYTKESKLHCGEVAVNCLIIKDGKFEEDKDKRDMCIEKSKEKLINE